MLACLAFPVNFSGGDRRLFDGSTKAVVTVVVAGMVSTAVVTSAGAVTAGVDISGWNCSCCGQDQSSLASSSSPEASFAHEFGYTL